MSQTDPVRHEVLPSGPDGLLVRFALTPEPAAMAAVRVLAARLEDAPLPGTVEIAPALVSLLVRFDLSIADIAAMAATLNALSQEIAQGALTIPEPARRWIIPTAFGDESGPQLAEIAKRLGLSEPQAIAQICEADLRVLTIGFAPGQPYIGLLPEPWNLPRLSELTPTVPAGAVVVAVRQVVVFGASSSTGWRQVGQAAFRSFRADRAEPMPLRNGDAIRFARADAAEIATLTDGPDGMGGARLEVLA
jgi:KipI family sensor histidine kinase inhibitor